MYQYQYQLQYKVDTTPQDLFDKEIVETDIVETVVSYSGKSII